MAQPVENWIVRIEGAISGERTRQTYELDYAELTIEQMMLPDLVVGYPAPMPGGQTFTLKAHIKKAQVELLPTIVEINAALADAYRLRQTIQEVAGMVSASTWRSAKATLEMALRKPGAEQG